MLQRTLTRFLSVSVGTEAKNTNKAIFSLIKLKNH